MTAMTIQEVSRRSGLSEPTLRYYEEVGLVGPVDRDERSGHRRYGDGDLDVLQALACLRALGMGIEDMRTYQANRRRASQGQHRRAVAAEQRDLLLRHADRLAAEIAALHTRLDYLREKSALWDARAHGDAAAETEAQRRVHAALSRMDMEMEIKR
jgi:MerR family transcriptional regulator, copper efflux regulator